ncbi:MAG: hypothetical protein JWO86_7439 [Myxococcaceae bacterium]|jgi:hypothetical protein|nr:hypothetical protein [Myxococcaceae bacterium]MEA2748526.1 hypothetical protein [Myxococcales bacterium]
MLNKLIVSSYKVAGFFILAAILAGLGSYVIMTLFYYGSSSWIAPLIVSPSDRRVLELSAQYAQEQSLRDTLSAQKSQMETKLRDAERIAQSEEAFQAGVRASLKADLEDRLATLSKLGSLRMGYVAASKEIAAANTDFAGLSRGRIKAMFEARLMTRDDVVKGNMELAGLANVSLGLGERGVMLDEQIIATRRQADSLVIINTLLGSNAGVRAPGSKVTYESGTARGIAPTHEVLAFQREFEISVLAQKRAKEEGDSIKEAISAADATLKRYDALLSSIKESPYLKAADHHLTIAFVPYMNLANAKEGTPVYACKGNIVWCRRVGHVGARLEGEVTGTHPVQKIDLRGQMVRLELDDMHTAEDPVMHLGRAPFLL